jgi:OPA family glycerol-3-phosphate transporter-like MFS transporter
MSILWPSLIRLLSQSLPAKDMARASVAMGTTVAVGTLMIYAFSALFVNIDFKLAFYLASAVLSCVALLWIFSYSRTVGAAVADFDAEEEQGVSVEREERADSNVKRALLLSVVVLCFYGVATNLIKDGLVGWVPSIMKEQYGLDSSFSIILTLLLPIVSIFGNAFAVKMHRRVPDYVLQCALTFLVSGAIIGAVIGGVSLGTFWITLVGFALVCFLVSSCNSLITSVFPLFMKGKLNSGFIAGILNGCSYIGSTISSYGLGVIADRAGWIAVFWTLLGVCGAVCFGALLYLLIKKRIIN